MERKDIPFLMTILKQTISLSHSLDLITDSFTDSVMVSLTAI